METTRSLSATKPSAAILFVHGILGTPDHFSFLLPHVPEEMTVSRLLLDGHGGTAGQFGSTSMATWRRQVDEAVSELRRNHRHVLIAAHSMGTLFAIDQAVRCRADRLFLLNPPLRLRITPRLLTTPLLVMSGHTEGNKRAAAARNACSVALDLNPLNYRGWPARYIELFAEIRRTRRIAPHLTVATDVILSTDDEMVSPSSADTFAGNSCVNITMLPESGHYYYSDSDTREIVRLFISFAGKS